MKAELKATITVACVIALVAAWVIWPASFAPSVIILSAAFSIAVLWLAAFLAFEEGK